MRVARRSADPFVRLVAGAATIWLCGQAVINIGYVTGLLPVTGIPLPFISAGGTSLLASFFVLGMLCPSPGTRRRRSPPPGATSAAAGARASQRWLRIPVPRPYQPPKRARRALGAGSSRPPGRPPTRRALGRRRAGGGPPRRAGRARAARCRPRRPTRQPAEQRTSPMASSAPARIVVAGGHSAGHIEPAMNFADAVRRLDPSAEITALGTERGLDTTLIPARGYPLELIPPVPLPRRLNRALLATPGRLRRSVRAAGAVLDARPRRGRRRLRRLRRDARLPRARRRRHIPIVVHEANARAGVANRVAARLTKHVFTASPSVQLPHAHADRHPAAPGDRRARPRRAARRGPRALRARPRRPGAAGHRRLAGRAGRSTPPSSAAAPALRAAGVQVLHIVGPKNAVDVAAGDAALRRRALRRRRCSTPTPRPISWSAARGR